MELTEIVKQIVQQVKSEQIKTVDLVEELNNLFKQVDKLSLDLKQANDSKISLVARVSELETLLSRYRQEYVEPAEKLKQREKELEDANKDWQLEKKYIIREAEILREVLAAITTTKTLSVSGNGSYYNESMNRPYLPKIEGK